MRGSLVVLALAVTPLVARVSRAQDARRDDGREVRVVSHDRDRGCDHDHDHDHDRDHDRHRGRDCDHDRDDDKKCEARKHGDAWEHARDHRPDPRDRKDCAPPPAPQPPPTTQPPPPPPPPPPAPTDTGTTSISGSLFHDLNTNAVFDPDEIGLAGWTVEVIGPVTQSTLSDGNGLYSFTGLPAGSYTVCVVPPAGWNQTLPMSGAACPNSFGFSVVAPKQEGDTSLTDIDFGFLSVPWGE